MDKTGITVSTFGRHAQAYQDRFMTYEPYVATYRNLLPFLDKKPDATVLDVACGPANISHFLLESMPGLDITGIDLSPEMIELARQNIPQGRFLVMDCRSIAALGQRYDLIICGFVFPYLSREEVAEFLQHAVQSLQPGGLLYFSTMLGDYADSGLKTRNETDSIYQYYHQQDYLKQQLLTHGFSVLIEESKSYPESEGTAALDYFVVAKAAAA